MAIKIGRPPKVNWKRIHGQVAFEYSQAIHPDSMDVRARASVKKRVNECGLDVVSKVIAFFDTWLKEDKWKNENYRFKGIGWFFAYKFDEIKGIMELRESNKPKYVDLSTVSDDNRFVDPFQQ